MRAPERARVLRRKKKRKRGRERKEEWKNEKEKRWCSTSSRRDEDGTAPPLPVYSTCLVVSNSKIPSTGCVSRILFFFSPPLPDETHLRYCLFALRNGGEGDTSKEEKDWDGKYGGNMNPDESSRERLLSSNSITSVKYILSNNRGRMVKSFNHTKWNGWETGEIYEIRVEILWKWEIQLFAMACN